MGLRAHARSNACPISRRVRPSLHSLPAVLTLVASGLSAQALALWDKVESDIKVRVPHTRLRSERSFLPKALQEQLRQEETFTTLQSNWLAAWEANRAEDALKKQEASTSSAHLGAQWLHQLLRSGEAR